MKVTIPDYTIIREVSKGGMATLYLATQLSLNRKVALKVVSPLLAEDPVFRKRFICEARTVAGLSHRNIVPVYDFGQHGDFHYLSMEYLPAGDLKRHIRCGIAPDHSLRIVYDIAKALVYVHSKAYIHRDIKPENILLRDDMSPVLTDFGISKAIDSAIISMTSTGMVVGSPRYMSPEQALAKKIDFRTDIYSLGVVLFELLSGRPMYEAHSCIATAIKHIADPIPDLPEQFARLQPVINKMVAKKRIHRFQSATEVVEALEIFLTIPSTQWNKQSWLSAQTRKMIANGKSKFSHPEKRHAMQITSTSSPRKSRRFPLEGFHPASSAPTMMAACNTSPPPLPEHPIAGKLQTKQLSRLSASVLFSTPLLAMALLLNPDISTSSSSPAAANLSGSFINVNHQLAASPQLLLPDTPLATVTALSEPKESSENDQRHFPGFSVHPPVPEGYPAQRADRPTHLKPATEFKTKHIAALLAQGKKAVNTFHLMMPENLSAYDKYCAILKLDPGNQAANNGLTLIVEKYLLLAKRAIKREEMNSAQVFVNRAKLIASRHALKIDLLHRVSGMQATIARMRYFDVQNRLAAWTKVLQESRTLSMDSLAQANAIYLQMLREYPNDTINSYSHEVYADTFFRLGKQSFKNNEMEKAERLITMGLEVSPGDEKLTNLQAHWERKKAGRQTILDFFY